MKRCHSEAARALAIGMLFLAGFVSLARAGTAQLPEPDETGSFVGTWYYVDPGFRIAIFVSEEAPGAFSIRYHVRDKKGIEYETDALGKAKFVDEDQLVHVTFTAKIVGSNKITGRHERLIEDKSGKVKESGTFEMYRAEFGRKLVLTYPEWKSERFAKTGRILRTNLQSDIVRLFRRASEIVVEFDEIKF